MSNTINCCVFSGRLTKVPEKRIIQSDGKDTSVCSFQLAVDKGFGENKRTIFPRFSAWRHDADFICDYGQKGQEVTVQCEYDIREAQVNGENRVFTNSL